MKPLERLMRPRSVAIIGASADPEKLNGRALAYLEKYGYRQAIYPVNPRYQSLGRHRCYPDIASLPQAPDVAIVLVRAERVPESVRQLASLGAGAAIVLASGFGETGEAGRQLEQQMKAAAGPMRLLGPNTIGLVNVTDHITLSASAALVTDELLNGSIALISQSGGILGSLLSRAQAQGIGFSKLVATGNECDLEVAEIVDHLVDDPATKVIALYLEQLRKPALFRQAALKARRAGKPIVVLKIGRSEAGIRSAVSHTGALAGSGAVYDGLFRQLGIIKAERFSDLLDIPMALSCERPLRGSNIAVITSTGGAASLLADAAGMLGLDTPPPDADAARRLAELKISGASLDRNPIDVTLAGVKSEYFRRILDIVLESPVYDGVAVVLGSSALREPETACGPLRECLARSDKPIVAYASPEAPHLVRQLNMAGVPTFAAPEGCVAALAAMRRITATAPTEIDATIASAPVSQDVRVMLRHGSFNEAESKALFARFGIPATREMAVRTPEEAVTAANQLTGRLVVKILSREISHKSEAGGVTLDVSSAEVEQTCRHQAEVFTRITQRKPEGFLIQEMVTEGLELVLGMKQDPQLGPVILLGMGGVAAELAQDTALRLAPVSRRDAQEMIEELRMSPILKGYRGRPVADVAALIDAIVAFSTMAVVIGDELSEAEINPLFVLPAGRGVVAADGVVIPRSLLAKP